MHVMTLLKADMFDVAIEGKSASIAQALPDWNAHDRFGLVIDDALGGIGPTDQRAGGQRLEVGRVAQRLPDRGQARFDRVDRLRFAGEFEQSGCVPPT